MGDLKRSAGSGAGGLFSQISALVEQTSTVVVTQANAELTLMNWEIGRLIDSDALRHQRAGYAVETVATLTLQLKVCLLGDGRDNEGKE